MKILLDENVDNRLKYFIEDLGFKVQTSYELELSGKTDREIIEFCDRKGYALLTHDDDFLSMASDMEEHPSIMYIPQRTHLRSIKDRFRKIESEALVEQNEIYFL